MATAGLIRCAGYPASMVGVPGAAISNLNPPTLAAVTFGLAQCGLATLLREPLGRWMRRPAAWAAVAVVNLFAMTVYLWHQTALMAVTALGLLAGAPLPGLHTVPDGLGWVLARLVWLPVFVLGLGVCWAAFWTYEQGGRGEEPGRIAGGEGAPARWGRGWNRGAEGGAGCIELILCGVGRAWRVR
ncbi:hypothetical protein ACFVXC_07080 [Streptomyces sp. NPDC058257]|uniref:hypothetical protein n=1 Tax=Streptomyces sp. NPDC058257 TaxID=3346409 RepID=UPI0036E9F778